MRQSLVRGADNPPLVEKTIGQAIEDAVRAHGERTALVSRHQHIRWSYRELHERALSLAEGLLALGLEPSDRIGIWAPNCTEWTLTKGPEIPHPRHGDERAWPR